MTTRRFLLLTALLAALVLVGCRSAHVTSAILYIDEQNYQKAVDVIEEGLRYNPDDPEAFYWQGEAYSRMAERAIQENDYAKAKQSYKLAYERYAKARDLAPEKMGDQVEESLAINYQNRLRDGDNNWNMKYYEQAEGYYRLAYYALPDSLTPIKNIARMKMQQAAQAEAPETRKALFGEALDLLDQVLAENPDAYDLRADKAFVLTTLGGPENLDRAEKIYTELLQDHGDDPALLTDVVNFALRRQNFEWAADLNVQIAGIYRNDTDAANDDQIAGLLHDAGQWYSLPSVARYETAIDVLNRASEENPLSKEILFDRLQTFYRYGVELKQQADAATDPARKDELRAKSQQIFQRGVEVGNALTSEYVDYADAFQFLALCQVELGDTAAAEQNFKTYNELTGTP